MEDVKASGTSLVFYMRIPMHPLALDPSLESGIFVGVGISFRHRLRAADRLEWFVSMFQSNMLHASRRFMFFKPLQLVHPVVRLAVVAGALTLLSGCQAVVSTAPAAQVRIINASPDAPGLDMYEGSTALAFNLGFGTITSYIPIAPGSFTINADASGSKQALATNRSIFAGSTQYTILVGNTLANLQQQTLTDQSQPAPSGQVSLRFIDQTTRSGAVDIYLVPSGQKLPAVTPLVTGVVFSTNTGYLNVPSGAYTIVMVPSGTAITTTTIPSYTGPQVAYAAGAVRTIVLIDQQLITAPGLQVITAEDFNSAVATS
ncbi:DUF4397 domain-containing protein [Granulicella sp. L60]|uniref:DUF4397 domain-containing protein n=1 Tax=Granulicella sp. L60 TaxID=1641866 RepID=UPI0020B11040|nr:DUF4397 domain-containing protein [Granulicella sp. L60]